MGEKAFIVKGDKTTHGGTVLEGFNDFTIQGIPVAGKGHKVSCPKCKGIYPIVQGYNSWIDDDRAIALHGFKTACGARLIASQHEMVADDDEEEDFVEYATLSNEQIDQKSMIDDGVYRPDHDKRKIVQVAAEEDDNLNPSRFRDGTGRETDLSEWSNEQNFNYWRKETKKIFPEYEVMRDPNKPYTQEDVESVKRDYEKAQRGEFLEQRLQKSEQFRKDNQNRSPLIFENFDRQDLIKQSECSPQELENHLRFLEKKGYIKEGTTNNFRRTGKWPENQPIPARSNNLTPEGDYDWDQTPYNGFLLNAKGKPIQEPVIPKAGDIIDRYGGEGGRFASPMDDLNNPTPYEQRSLPYVRDPSAYHRYRFNDDMSNFQKWVENSDLQTREEINDLMEKKGITYDDLTQKGLIAPAFNQQGGGIQYQFEIPLSLLRRSGILSEIPK